MSAESQKRTPSTHVRVYPEKKERAKEISRQLAAKTKKDVYYTYLIDEVLEKGFAKLERQLGISNSK
jgi:hypothetical protein